MSLITLDLYKASSSTLHSIPLLPSKDEAEKTFWGLADRFWMQIIDGKFHLHGPMVFDLALHNGEKEEGFFNSLVNGCKFASAHLTEKPSVAFYQKLHEQLCSHFKGQENNTLIQGWETGFFRRSDKHCERSLSSFSEEIEKDYSIVSTYESKDSMNFYKENNTELYQKICSAYPTSKIKVTEWESLWEEKADKMHRYLSGICTSLNIPEFTSINKTDNKIKIYYYLSNPTAIEKIVEKLFDRYNQKIDEINAKLVNAADENLIKQHHGEKVEAIADLYQLLEWLHPFPDGQGRTDLVLMSKLLCEQGPNPALLDEPYVSTWALLPEWKEALLKGIELWKQEKAKT